MKKYDWDACDDDDVNEVKQKVSDMLESTKIPAHLAAYVLIELLIGDDTSDDWIGYIDEVRNEVLYVVSSKVKPKDGSIYLKNASTELQ